MEKGALLGKTSTSQGSSFTGQRIYCGLVTKKRGTGSKAHYHPDETFNYVLEGALKVNMDGQEFVVPKGSLLHIPPNVVHTAVATDDADATYLVWRDIASEKEGKASTVEV
jgi:quercetin dioxygenase-like cupin family protein